MADDDNFDIDIYGDESYQDTNTQQDTNLPDSNAPDTHADAVATAGSSDAVKNGDDNTTAKREAANGASNGDTGHEATTQQIASTGGSAYNQEVHKQAPQKQGMKRKQGEDDDRPIGPGATAAITVNELNWWISEEDIRGWANQSGCEDELTEITFNEHKVNGKSKGQVYIQLQSPQAATAFKSQIEKLFEDQTHTKKPTVFFNAPHNNPFKTLPKDVPAREKGRSERGGGNFSNSGGGNFNRFNNNNSRGNFNNNRGGSMGFQNNRNFSGPPANNMGGNMGGFGQGPMNNFGNAMGGSMNNFGGGFNRGGMMNNMRGGMNNRGGRGGNIGMNGMGMGMPMGNNMMGMGGGMMGMGGAMGGNMGMMGGGMGGFGGNQPQFNPAFFGQNQGGNDGNWNPHGAKRPRPE